MTASDVVPCITPPPLLEDRKHDGKAMILASQSMTITSSSVTAGAHSQLNAETANALEYSSPSMLGYEVGAGKYAIKLGEFLQSSKRMFCKNPKSPPWRGRVRFTNESFRA